MPDVPEHLRPVGSGGGGDGSPSPDRHEHEPRATHQEVTARAVIAPTREAYQNGNVTPYPIVEFTYESSRYNQAALITVKAVADRFPEQGEYLGVSVNGVPVASGRVDVASPTDDGLVSIDAYDSVRRLKQATITQEFPDTRIDTAVGVVYASAGVEGAADFEMPPNISITFENTNTATALDELAHRVRGAWYADPALPGGEPFFTDTIETVRHDIKHILGDTDPGLQTEPYDGVRVVGGIPQGAGSGSGSESGSASRTNAIAKNPITATAGATGDDQRVYRHEDQSIRSQDEANRVAHSYYDEFERQQSSGKITLVGDERIQPLNTVVMPDSLGGAEYLVSEVTHEASVSNGFVTTLTVGGLIDPERGPGRPSSAQRQLLAGA